MKNVNIGDTGIKLISEGLFENEHLEELDISSNSLTIEGFIPLCDSILTNNIQSLKCRNNLLGDESMKYFASTVLSIENNKPKSKLVSFDFSGSKIYDQGLIYLLYQLQNNTFIKKIKLKDNYFTHEVDVIVLEFLEKNKTLIKFDVEKNRLTLICMQKIKEIIERNKKIKDDKEPNRLLVEVYRLRYENTKLEEMKESLRFLENNVEKIKLNRADIKQEFDMFKKEKDEEFDSITRRLEKTKLNLQNSFLENKNLKSQIDITKEDCRLKLEEAELKIEEVKQKEEELKKYFDDLKINFEEEERKFIIDYDNIRSESQHNLEKLKEIENNSLDLMEKLKHADKYIFKLRKQGRLPPENLS